MSAPSGRCLTDARPGATVALRSDAVERLARCARDVARERRRAAGRQLLAQELEYSPSFREACPVGILAGALDEQHEFAALLVGVGGDAARQRIERAVEDGLEQFRQLARNDAAAFRAEHRGEIGKGFGDAVARLVE